MSDELRRWAEARAPDLLARAEAEAVAELRRALMEAALAPPPVRAPEARPRETVRGHAAGNGVWVYCVVAAGSTLPDGLTGVHESHAPTLIREGQLAAVVSAVPFSEFGEEPLRRNLNDLAWLERVARAHERVLERMLAEATLVPLRLCTIFDDEAGARAMVGRERTAFVDALGRLEGHEEWGVKLLVDREALEAAARGRLAGSGTDPGAAPPAGGEGYLQRKRFEREVADEAYGIAAELTDEIHARLESCARDAVLGKSQNRELSRHEGEMLLNGAYLVEAGRIGELRDLVSDLEARHADVGARLELTGPWPPYNFVSTEAAVA